MIDIKDIQKDIKNENYFFSKHGDEERKNDNLTIYEVEEAILNGRILENYQDDKRGESCLVVGFTQLGKPIHIVCARSGDSTIIITVYIPSSPKFKNPYERG